MIAEFCQRTGADPAYVEMELVLCREIGVVDTSPEGFVAYFRCREEGELAIRRGDTEAIRRAAAPDGPLLFVVILLARGVDFGYTTGRRLSGMAGVERIMTYTKGRFRSRRVWASGSKTQ